MLVSKDGLRGYVELRTWAFVWHADFDPTALRVRLLGDSRVDGWLEIDAATIARASDGQARLAVNLSNVKPQRPLVLERPCDELSPVDRSRVFVGSDPGPSALRFVSLKRRTPLSRRPGGRADAYTTRALASIAVLEEEADFYQVEIPASDGTAVAWIRKQQGRASEPPVTFNMLGRGGPTGPMTCERDVLLYVHSGNGLYQVGNIRANRRFAGTLLPSGIVRIDTRTDLRDPATHYAFVAADQSRLCYEVAAPDGGSAAATVSGTADASIGVTARPSALSHEHPSDGTLPV